MTEDYLRSEDDVFFDVMTNEEYESIEKNSLLSELDRFRKPTRKVNDGIDKSESAINKVEARKCVLKKHSKKRIKYEKDPNNLLNYV